MGLDINAKQTEQGIEQKVGDQDPSVKEDPILKILEGDVKEEPKQEIKKNVVPESIFLKNKSEKKMLKQENDQLKKDLAEIKELLKTKTPVTAEEESKSETKKGVDEDEVEKIITEREQKRKAEAIENHYETRIVSVAPKFQERFQNAVKENPTLKDVFTDAEFAEDFKVLGLPTLTRLMEHEYAPQLMNVLHKNKELMRGLANNEVEAHVDFGRMLGKLENVPKTNNHPPIVPNKDDKTSSNKGTDYDPNNPKAYVNDILSRIKQGK